MWPRPLILALVLIVVASIQGNQFRADYALHARAGAWLKLHRVPRDWHSARLQCYYEGAVLASPLNLELATALKEMMVDAKLDKMFTGVHATHSDGVYTSVEGVSLNKMSIQWNDAGVDNNYREFQQCTMLLDGGLVDSSCDDFAPFACSRQARADDELSACGTVDAEYMMDARTGHCYKFHDQPQTWARAHAACQAEGAHLAVVNSAAEARIMLELFRKHPPQYSAYSGSAFVGFRKWGPSDTWWTIHGEMLKYSGYTTWADGQPNNYARSEVGFDKQLCGSIDSDGGLNDVWCLQPLAFICEKTKNSLLNATSEHY